MWWIPQTSNSLEGIGISFFFQHWSPDLRLCLFLPLYPLPTTLLHIIWSNGCNKLSLVWVSFLLLFTLWMVSDAKQHLLPWGILTAFFFLFCFLSVAPTNRILSAVSSHRRGRSLAPATAAGCFSAAQIRRSWKSRSSELVGSRPA